MKKVLWLTRLNSVQSPSGHLDTSVQVADFRLDTRVKQEVAHLYRYQNECLSFFLEVGRRYHGHCSDCHIQRVETGYYHYEQDEHWQTNALAAICAGAFGKDFIEKAISFSISEATWRLSKKLNMDLSQVSVHSPIYPYHLVNVIDEIDRLDAEGWTREGIAEWLRSVGL